MPAKLKPLVIEEISFVDKGASGDDSHRPEIVFWKGDTMPIDASKVEAILARMDEEDRNVMIEALAAAKQDEPAAPEPEEKQEDEEEKPPMPPADEEEKMEGEDEKEKVDKRAVEMRKQLDDANAKIAKLEGEQKLASFVKTASEDMAHVPGMAPEDLGAVLKACSEALPEETFGKLKTTLTACSRTIEKGDLFVEIGGSGEASGALDKLRKLAKTLHDETPDKSYEHCYTKVVKAHPDLYAAAKAEEA